MMPLITAALVITVLGLLPAATAAAVRYEMARNARVVPGPLRLVFWAAVQWGGVALVLLALPQALMPTYIGVVIGFILVSLLILALLGRRHESVALLNESIRVICRRGGSLADMAEAFARGDPSVLAGRARRFADAVRRGVPADQAARQARLPLNAETMLALDHRQQPAWQQAGQESDEGYRGGEFPRVTWPAASQAAYFLTLVIGALLVTAFLTTFIVPTLREMSEELEIQLSLNRPGARQQVDAVVAVVTLLSLAVVVIAALHLLYWITDSRWIGRLLPVTGPMLQSRRRSSSLRGVAAAIDAGTEASQALTMASQAGFRTGESVRLRRAAALAASGTSLGRALHDAGLVDGRQQPWIDAALSTGHVADALRNVAASAERYARIRFDAMSTVLFPLGVLGCGLLILWVARLVFGSIVDLINAMA